MKPEAQSRSGLAALLPAVVDTRVRVTAGPLWGLEGVVDDPADPKGIIVAVDVLQQGLHVRMSLENIEPLP